VRLLNAHCILSTAKGVRVPSELRPLSDHTCVGLVRK